jgi:hypothetical protein
MVIVTPLAFTPGSLRGILLPKWRALRGWRPLVVTKNYSFFIYASNYSKDKTLVGGSEPAGGR